MILMRMSTIIIISAAVISGLIAVFLMQSFITSAPKQDAGLKIVVAARSLSFGEIIRETDLQEVAWSASQLPEGGFQSIKQIIQQGAPERYALSNIPKSTPIVATQITKPGQKASLASMISEGKSAVTIRVDDVRGVAGFIMPGDRVDVALTRINQINHEGYVDTILRDLRVLAIDQLVKERQDTAQVAKSVTLEVTPIDAEKLRLASEVGTLSLTLRNNKDNESKTVDRITTSDLSGLDTAAAAHNPNMESNTEPPTDTPRKLRTNNIRIIRGGVINELPVAVE